MDVALSIAFSKFWKEFFAEICQVTAISDFLNCKWEVEFGSQSEKYHTNVLLYEMYHV